MQEQQNRRWYQIDTQDAFQFLDSSKQGLSSQEASARLARFGPNVPAREEGINILVLLINQIKSPLVIILLMAAAITMVLGEYVDSLVIALVITVNTVIGFVQELRAEQSVRSLQRMVSHRARVLRDGMEKEVDVSEIAPGDVAFLFSGGMVPADLRLFWTVELKIDESMLTGESLPADKLIDSIKADGLTAGDQRNMAFMGTSVVNGRAAGLVVATASATALGSIATNIRDIGVVRAPIQDTIARFAHLIGYLVMGACAVLFVVGLIMGFSVREMFLVAVAAAVAAIPEGMPIVVTVALAAGVSRMAKVKAIVRKLPAVETLGSATVICSDKTGTLTLNQMTVRKAYAGEKVFDLAGEGYQPHGDILVDGHEPDQQEMASLRMLLQAGLLCNESSLVETDGGFEVHGDPTEAALIVAAMKAGLHHGTEETAYPRLGILPFESERGYMATLHEHQGRRFIFAKGGLDRLLEVCTACVLDETLVKSEIKRHAEVFARDGMRVLAMAMKEVPGDYHQVSESDLTSGLTLLGIQAMIDPPRPEAAASVAGCKRSGIRVKMITGDHADTALAIAQQIGIAGPGDRVLTGRQIASMEDAELNALVEDVHVYARIAPDHKYRIVEHLKARGSIVAVTGDGVNDAPALKAAHIGVAMGKNGTDVAREAADMVLADDNFASIYRAVREGRIVFDNLRKAVFFLIPTGMASIWSILAALVAGVPIPYTAAQLLWINLVTNGMQDVSLAFEPGERGIEDRPPRKPGEKLLNRLLVERSILVSLTIACGILGVYFQARATGATLEKARTMAVTTMVFFQFFQAWNSRSERLSIFSIPIFSNWFLFISLVLASLAQVAMVYWSPLQWVFKTSPLLAVDWALILAVSSSVLMIVEADKFIRAKLKSAVY